VDFSAYSMMQWMNSFCEYEALCSPGFSREGTSFIGRADALSCLRYLLRKFFVAFRRHATFASARSRSYRRGSAFRIASIVGTEDLSTRITRAYRKFPRDAFIDGRYFLARCCLVKGSGKKNLLGVSPWGIARISVQQFRPAALRGGKFEVRAEEEVSMSVTGWGNFGNDIRDLRDRAAMTRRIAKEVSDEEAAKSLHKHALELERQAAALAAREPARRSSSTSR